MSLSENSKIHTSERSLLSDDSINAVTLTKDVIRVTESRHAHKMLITPSLMQARRCACAVYTKCMGDEKQQMDMQQKAKIVKEDHDPQNILI